MKCVICKDKAEVVFNGCSLCEEHLSKERDKVNKFMMNSAQMINNIGNKMGLPITQNFEIK